MRWQSFDEWVKRRSLSFDDLPVTIEDRPMEGSVPEQPPPPIAPRAYRSPGDTGQKCMRRHRHEKRAPSSHCKCGCLFCWGIA